MKISIIAAIGKNRELGKNNKLLWYIPEDLKRFHLITKGHVVIMGRKTWESLPKKPLVERYNIVITRDPEFKINNLRKGKDFGIVDSLENAIKKSKEILNAKYLIPNADEIFVIGGGQIYQQAISIADKLYLTIVEESFDADTFFPDYSQFKKVIFEKESKSEKYKYKFLELEK